MSLRKRRSSSEGIMEKEFKRKKVGINLYIPLHKLNLSDEKKEATNSSLNEAKIYTQEEVTTLLHKQEQAFRALLDEKLREECEKLGGESGGAGSGFGFRDMSFTFKDEKSSREFIKLLKSKEFKKFKIKIGW